MATHIMQQPEQVWPAMASWAAPATQSCGGNTWSKRLASAMDSDSWEVRAFAEDASSSGQWPPRSYSCSFCQREFRTAQALGGHMNVHRRERAHANQLAQLRNAAKAASQSIHLELCAAPKTGGNDAGSADLSLLQSLSKPRLPTTPPAHTAEFLYSKSLSSSQLSLSISGSILNSGGSLLSTSPPSQESISSSSGETTQRLGTKPLLQSIPDTLCETLSQQTAWASSSRAFHPYEKSRCMPGSKVNLRRFSLCLNKVMGEQEDTLDLELRLGRSSCTI